MHVSNTRPSWLRRRSLAAVALISIAVCACGQSQVPETNVDAEAVAALPEITRQRVTDLVAINDALERYHAAHGTYPPSEGLQGYVSEWGASLGENWIPALSEQLSQLPRDPAQAVLAQEPQYLYISDGQQGYKLIAHLSGDCSSQIELNGIRIDPVRVNGDFCNAYGFWSEAGANF